MEAVRLESTVGDIAVLRTSGAKTLCIKPSLTRPPLGGTSRHLMPIFTAYSGGDICRQRCVPATVQGNEMK